MIPAIQDGEILQVKAVDSRDVRVGDIVLFRADESFKAHRVIRKSKDRFVIRGDAGAEADTAIRGEQIMGKIISKECAETGASIDLQGTSARMKFAACAARRMVATNVRGWLGVFFASALVVSLCIFPIVASAQQTVGGVALDTTSSQTFTVGGNGSTCTAGTGTTWNCSFTHTTNTVIGSTGLLVVGFSLNMQGNGSDSQVTAVSYGGTSMGSPPINYSPGNNFRVQIYYLKNPATGTNKTITFTVNKTGGQGNSLGCVAGAISLYQVNQTFGTTYPISATGFATSATAAVTFSGTNKPANNDAVIDVLAAAQGTIVTPNTSITAPLVFENTQWDAQSGTSGQDVKGHSSSSGGLGATLTMQEGLNASTAWTLAAIAFPASQPTAVKTDSFSATQSSNGTVLSWHTSGEMHNLGFNVYRDVGGQKIKVNQSLIAGSALLMRESAEQHGARTYGWIDRSPSSSALYWLEDVDVNGTRTLHGPVQAELQAAPAAQFSSMASVHTSATLGDFARSNAANSFDSAHVREARVHPTSTPATRAIGFQLASQCAVKISVDHEGWYRVTQPELVAAGLSADVDASKLHLYAEGVEQAIRVTGGKSGFGADSAIEFYGTGIDTPYTGERVYWLVASNRPGKRIETAAAGSAGPAAQSFIQTIELKPRTTYFAALLKEDTDNFFGNVISPVPDTETINVSNAIQGQGKLMVALQGITLGQQHDVTVTLNGATLGSVNFADQEKGKATLQIPAGVLINGANTITFTAQQGDNDLSLVDYIHLSFPHSFTAETDQLKFTAAAGQAITISGFASPPSRLVDISDPERPVAIRFKTSGQSGNYALSISVPWGAFASHT